jgi:hypothetical protein
VSPNLPQPQRCPDEPEAEDDHDMDPSDDEDDDGDYDHDLPNTKHARRVRLNGKSSIINEIIVVRAFTIGLWIEACVFCLNGGSMFIEIPYSLYSGLDINEIYQVQLVALQDASAGEAQAQLTSIKAHLGNHRRWIQMLRDAGVLGPQHPDTTLPMMGDGAIM